MAKLYSYTEMLKKYGSAYQIRHAVDSGALYKVARGLYSDELNPAPEVIICALYPQAILTMDSAFYFHGLTDVIPSLIHVATPRNSTRINFTGVRQYFMGPQLISQGVCSTTQEGAHVKIFSKERMLVELLRHSTSLPPDYYKELIVSYRRIAHNLDIREVESCINLYRRACGLFDKMLKEVF